MAVSFGVAALFDVCALLLVVLVIRGRQATPATAPEPRLVRVGEQAD